MKQTRWLSESSRLSECTRLYPIKEHDKGPDKNSQDKTSPSIFFTLNKTSRKDSPSRTQHLMFPCRFRHPGQIIPCCFCHRGHNIPLSVMFSGKNTHKYHTILVSLEKVHVTIMFFYETLIYSVLFLEFLSVGGNHLKWIDPDETTHFSYYV